MRALSRRLLAGVGLAALVSSSAYADTQAIDVTTVGTYPPLTNNGFNYYQAPGGYNFSWNFTLNSAIQVTQLGYYDSALAGTAEPNGFGSHFVSLFDVTTDTTLASATVTDTSPVTGVFNYAPIAPVTLAASDTYTISGDMTDQYYLVGLNQAAAPAAPEINYQFTNTNIFGTTGPPGTYEDFGPNFQFATAVTCTENVPGRNVIALAGDKCTAAGTYNPTTTTTALPVTYNGFGFYANGGTITSRGAVTINTSDPNNAGGSYALWADGAGSQITLGGATNLTTRGANSYGAYAMAGGQIHSTGPLSVATTSLGAIGLYASGAGSSIVAALGAVTTSGALTPGVQADGGATVTLTGGTVTTQGPGSWGLSASGVGSLISATGVTVTTSGGVDTSNAVALGAFAQNGATIALTNTIVTTGGASAHGVEAGGAGSVTLSGGSVTTGGGGAYGLFATDANSTIAASNGVAIKTTGIASDGVFVTSGASVTLTGASIATQGAQAVGVLVNGAGSTLPASAADISTKGGVVGALQAQRFAAASSATANLTNAVLNGVTVATSGNAAHGIVVTGAGAAVTFAGAQNLTTTGAGALGVYASAGGVATGAGTLNIKTSGTNALSNGLSAMGVNADGSGSSITFGGGAIVTTGVGAVGLMASDRNDTGAGGSIVVNGPLTVTTQSSLAYDAFASGAGSRIALNGDTTLNVGAGSFGLYATGGGVVTTGAGLTINAGQTGFGGGVEADAGSSVTLGGTSSIHLTGTNLVGLLATGAGVISTSAALTLDAGANSGVLAQGGTVTLGGATSVSNTGAGLNGVLASGGGSVTASNGLSVATTGAGATAVLATGASSSISAANVAITTSGASSFGAVADQGATLSLNGGSIQTTAVGAGGLRVLGTGSSLTASNLSVGAVGGQDTATGFFGHAIYNGPGSTTTAGGALTLTNVTATAAGLQSDAVWTDAGGVTRVTGGNFSTSGADAGAAAVVNGGSLTISGATLTTSGDGSSALFINGSGGTVTATNLTISTSGGVWTAGNGSHAEGIFNGTFGSFNGGGVMNVTDTVVKTTGAQSDGVSVGAGGTTTFLGGSVVTQGAGANAATAVGAGSLTIGRDGAGNAAHLTTMGAGAYVASATGTGFVSLNGAILVSTGDGSGGLAVNGSGAELDIANSTVSTSGGLDTASGLHAYGAANTAFETFTTGGSLKLNSTQISTSGAAMFGVYTGAASTTTISGGSISTSGAGAHALYTTGAGAIVTATVATLATQGANAYGAYVSAGGALGLDRVQIQSSGSGGGGVSVIGAGSSASLGGEIGIVSQAGGSALRAEGGGTIAVSGPLTIQAGGTGVSINGGSVSVTSALSLKTASAPAFSLSGDNSTFNGAGGGTIDAAGSVIEFLDGTNQSASFDGYTINSASGDLAFADPSTSTLNFNNSTVNAGGGDLLDATAGSTITLNASRSALTGAVATDATSTSNVNLSNASSLTLTGNSTITNLSVANSSVAFAPSTGGGFHTLTLTNYAASAGALTLNAALGGANPGADQIVINGGRAAGTTLLTIRSLGASTGSPSASVPLIVTTHGGTIAPGAFALATPVVVNGYNYTLQQENGGDFLVSNATQNASQGAASLSTLSQARQSQTVTTKLLSSILTGATEQINCSSCSSGFASFGSFALGAHGRWTLNDNWALLAGGSYDNFSSHGVTVNNSMLVALALRYDAVQLGKNRPFAEAGVTAQPWASVTYRRSYDSALGGGVGVGTALSRSIAAYGRVGYIWRISRADEAAVYGDLTRSWDYTSGYTESANPGNPNGATLSPTLDTLNVARVGAQYTHLFGQHIEGNVSAGFAQAFGAAYGTSAALDGLGVEAGTAASSFNWWELGGRVSYRFSKTVTADVFAIGTLGAQPVGDQIHGGVALRMAF